MPNSAAVVLLTVADPVFEGVETLINRLLGVQKTWKHIG